jgi:hypothetical protein
MPGPRPIPSTFPDDFLQDAHNAVRRRTIAVQDAQRYRLVLVLAEHRVRLKLYEELTNGRPKPFQWNFTRKKLYEWLKRSKPHFSPSHPGD